MRVLRVSDSLIGYYYPSSKATCYFEKSQYLKNSTATYWCNYNLNLCGFNSTSKYIIEVSNCNSSSFAMNYYSYENGSFKNQSKVDSMSYSGTLQLSAFTDNYYSFIKKMSNGTYVLNISKYSSANIYSRNLSFTSQVLTMREMNSTYLKLYYANATSLFTEEIDMSINQIKTTKSISSIGSPRSIATGDNMIAVYYMYNYNATISLYNDSDLATLYKRENSTNYYSYPSDDLYQIKFMKGNTNPVIIYSLPNHRYYLHKMLTSIEVFSDKINAKTVYIGNDLIINEFSTDYYYYYYTYENNGPLFELDNGNKLYFNIKNKTSNYAEVQVLKMCAHNQYYLPDDTCSPVSYNYLTNGIQDDKQVACFEANIESNYNLALVNQQCSYSCNEGYYGVNCEDCDTYMERRELPAQVYYKYTYDSRSKTCVQVYDI